jgi:hypothetical protein
MRRPTGKSFLVPSYNVELAEPVKPGDIISFNYETYLSNEVPVNPKIYRIRKDVVWEDILDDATQTQPQPQELNGIHKNKNKKIKKAKKSIQKLLRSLPDTRKERVDFGLPKMERMPAPFLSR